MRRDRATPARRSRPPRLLAVSNRPVLPADHPDAPSEHDIIDTAKEVCAMLAEAGFDVRHAECDRDPRELMSALRKHKPDAVVNLFEGLATQTGTEISVAALYEWLGVSFTGCGSSAIALGRDKFRSKRILQGAGLPTARFIAVEQLPIPRWDFAYPAIVKPAMQDSSVGIAQASVVTNAEEMARRVGYVLATYGAPVLVEEFIVGRELHVNLFEEAGPDGRTRLVHVPIAEIVFEYEPEQNLWPIYSFDAKWSLESEEYLCTPLEAPVIFPDAIARRIAEVAAEAFRLVGCRDSARIDVRLTPEGVPYVLEVNPNPYLLSAALRRGLEAMDRTHADYLVAISKNALARAGWDASNLKLRPKTLSGELPCPSP